MSIQKSSGAHSHYDSCGCVPPYSNTSRVRTYPHHPIRTFFNNPNRKSYLIENRTPYTLLLSIHRESWTNNEKVKYFVLKPFDQERFHVNTSKEVHQYLRIHDPETKRVIDSKFLNPVYSLASIMGGHPLNMGRNRSTRPISDDLVLPRIQLSVTPGF